MTKLVTKAEKRLASTTGQWSKEYLKINHRLLQEMQSVTVPWPEHHGKSAGRQGTCCACQMAQEDLRTTSILQRRLGEKSLQKNRKTFRWLKKSAKGSDPKYWISKVSKHVDMLQMTKILLII